MCSGRRGPGDVADGDSRRLLLELVSDAPIDEEAIVTREIRTDERDYLFSSRVRPLSVTVRDPEGQVVEQDEVELPWDLMAAGIAPALPQIRTLAPGSADRRAMMRAAATLVAALELERWVRSRPGTWGGDAADVPVVFHDTVSANLDATAALAALDGYTNNIDGASNDMILLCAVYF